MYLYRQNKPFGFKKQAQCACDFSPNFCLHGSLTFSCTNRSIAKQSCKLRTRIACALSLLFKLQLGLFYKYRISGDPPPRGRTYYNWSPLLILHLYYPPLSHSGLLKIKWSPPPNSNTFLHLHLRSFPHIEGERRRSQFYSPAVEPNEMQQVKCWPL